MTRAEESFKAWLRSPERIFVPKLKERYAQGQALGLSRQAVKAVLAKEPELTRLTSGRIPQGQTAFRLRFWHEAEVDLGFLHWNSVGHGTFFLGKYFSISVALAPTSVLVWHAPLQGRALGGGA